jgi:hypothetical protein
VIGVTIETIPRYLLLQAKIVCENISISNEPYSVCLKRVVVYMSRTP